MKKNKQQKLVPSDAKVDLQKRKRYSPYSFRVFIALHGKVSFVFFMWMIMSFMFFLITIVESIESYERFIWISVSVFSVYSLIVIISYLRFWGWKDRLPFPVKGWDELLAERSTITDDKYRMAFFEIVPFEGTFGVDLSYLNAALKIHNEKQNRHIGKKSLGFENRTQWSITAKLEASGSVNSYGIGRMMNCMREECTEIAKRTGCIKEIQIHFDKRDFSYHQRPIV